MATKNVLQFFKALKSNKGVPPQKDTTNANWLFLGGGFKLNASDIFYDDSNSQLGVYNVQQAIEVINNYPSRNKEIRTGGYFEGKPVYKSVLYQLYDFIEDDKWHGVDLFFKAGIPSPKGHVLRSNVWLIPRNDPNEDWNDTSVFAIPYDNGTYFIRNNRFGIHYVLPTGTKWKNNYKGFFAVYEYTKEK